MRKFINKIIKEIPLLVNVALMLSIAATLSISSDGIYFNLISFIVALIKSLVFAFIFSILSYNRILRWIFFLFNLTWSEISIYLTIQFHSRITPILLGIVLQTDSNETLEFFQTFFSWNIIVILTAITIFFIVEFIYFLKYWEKRSKSLISNVDLYSNRKLRIIVISSISILFISFIANFQSKIINRFYSEENRPEWIVKITDTYNPTLVYFQIFYSSRYLGNNRVIVDNIYKANNDAKVDSCNVASPNIIVVIGESFIKRHSSLYGYYLNTNPNLLKDKEKGNLFVFNDVITYAPSTATFIKFFYSICNSQDSENWDQYPLFPALLKKAGWNVRLFDNQSTRSSSSSPIDDYSVSFFINPIKIHNQCFSYRNSKTSNFDGDFILNETDSLMLNNKFPQLNIIHLYGQHIKADSRYPHTAEFSYFTADSIKRNDLKNDISKLRTIASYDNATRYNDFVLKSIIDLYRNDDAIIIYVSDHGDSQYDDHNLTVGRMIGDQSSELIKLYCEVPMVIWCSDKYLEKHPDIVNNISNAVDKPFMTDDLTQVILDLAGINTKFFKKERSVINPDFKPQDRVVYIFDNKFEYDKNKPILDKVEFPK